jgi:hypothetical protein
MLVPRLPLQLLHGMYSIYIYIYDEKSWSQDFPYSLFMACTAYIYIMKNVGSKTSHTASTWHVQPIYMMKKSCSQDFPLRFYVACTAYIYDEKAGPGASPTTRT